LQILRNRPWLVAKPTDVLRRNRTLGAIGLRLGCNFEKQDERVEPFRSVRSSGLAFNARHATPMQSEPGPEVGHRVLFVLPDEVEFGQTEGVGFVFAVAQVGVEALHENARGSVVNLPWAGD